MNLVKKSLFLKKLNFSLFKNSNVNYIYFYNENYFCLIKLNNKTTLNIKNNKFIDFITTNNYDLNTVSRIELFIIQFSQTEYTKIKFTGKGYKIKKNTNNSVVLLFNRAHTTTLWWKNLFLKKLKKYKMYIKYTKLNYNVIDTILKVRQLNIFTKKGLRLSRQVVLKKKGKK